MKTLKNHTQIEGKETNSDDLVYSSTPGYFDQRKINIYNESKPWAGYLNSDSKLDVVGTPPFELNKLIDLFK